MFKRLAPKKELALVRDGSPRALLQYLRPLIGVALVRVPDRSRRPLLRRALVRDVRLARLRYLAGETWKRRVAFAVYFTWYIHRRVARQPIGRAKNKKASKRNR